MLRINAPSESFFSTYEHEWGGQHASLPFAHAVIGDYIDGFYNTVRLHSTTGHVSPIEFEVISTLADKVA